MKPTLLQENEEIKFFNIISEDVVIKGKNNENNLDQSRQ